MACILQITSANRKNDLILIMTPEKQDKTLELSRISHTGTQYIEMIEFLTMFLCSLEGIFSVR